MPKRKRTKKTIRAIVMSRASTLGVTPQGELTTIEKAPSYRDALAVIPKSAGVADRYNVYMEFIKEVGSDASDDTKRKFRKRLGLGGTSAILSS